VRLAQRSRTRDISVAFDRTSICIRCRYAALAVLKSRTKAIARDHRSACTISGTVPSLIVFSVSCARLVPRHEPRLETLDVEPTRNFICLARRLSWHLNVSSIAEAQLHIAQSRDLLLEKAGDPDDGLRTTDIQMCILHGQGRVRRG